MNIAVVADVHLHDLYGGYGWVEAGSGHIALRTLEDTMASTRVFNESYPAFLAVLDDIVRRGIRDVVLLGDYSDDGQLGAVAAVKRILSSYESRHGLRFFATFGNHDCFGPARRHQAKWLTQADGLVPVMVTSDESIAAPAVVRGGMIGMSTADAIEAMAHYGIMRPEGVLHWETPFGDQDGLEQCRSKDRDPECLDASYLVEPQEGLWLLILDANVFHLLDGIWQVRSNAAWDHVLAQRPYILDWIANVAERSRQTGKTLLAFSHYPVLPLATTGEGGSQQAACMPGWSKRMPSLESGRLLAQAGMRWHFSGHMHVAGRVELYGLTNIAVPSPAAFPGGYMVVGVAEGQPAIDLVPPTEVPGFDVAFAAYRQQSFSEAHAQFKAAINATTYGGFLEAHLKNLLRNKALQDDWPAELHVDLGSTSE
ncbi:metallophosphoesterase [Rhizobium sp. 25PS6]|uniref:metallophosphoesterase family protein n=1 Tax=Rhizobium sp. 25PS6 TaxID=3075622 RepID=UPI0028FCFFA4|nr:metallophosphoesterase [Rhizobium sp. 25PS6]MDU0364284.1 metallophosphoesterase [Rhizobium sp. 25PS6]